MSNFFRLLALLAAAALVPAALAQKDYPAGKVVKLVVPFPAGASTDAVSRLVAQRLGEALATPVIVDNRPGASGIIGSEIVAKSAPDGLTLMFTIGAPMVMNPITYKKLPYDADRDFMPVARIATLTSFLVVTPAFPAKDIREFMALAKAKSRRITFGSFGTGTGGHVAGEFFNKVYGSAMDHVPYKGVADAMRDVITGQIDTMFIDLTTAGPLIRSGKLRALAAVGTARAPALPNAPTFAESGFPGLERMSKGWYGLLAPAITPRPVLERLAREAETIVHSADTAAKFAEWGLEPAGMTLERFSEQIRAERALNAKIIAEIGGITLD